MYYRVNVEHFHCNLTNFGDIKAGANHGIVGPGQMIKDSNTTSQAKLHKFSPADFATYRLRNTRSSRCFKGRKQLHCSCFCGENGCTLFCASTSSWKDCLQTRRFACEAKLHKLSTAENTRGSRCFKGRKQLHCSCFCGENGCTLFCASKSS